MRIDDLKPHAAPDPPTYCTPAEAALVLRVSAPTVRRLAADGSIAARRVGRQWRVDRDALLVRGA